MDMPQEVHPYPVLAARIRAVAERDPSWTLSEISCLVYPTGSFPLLALSRNGIPEAPLVSLSAGIHGDEPAAVEAVLRLVESDLLLQIPLRLTVLPCQNPFGYARGKRTNGDGLDLNRQFDKPDSPAQEARALRRHFLRNPPDLVVECHEDGDTDGFYVWELRRPGRPEIGRAIVHRVREKGRVTPARAVEGCFVTDGVAHPTADRIARVGGWSHTYYLYRNGTPHCLTPETPSSFPMEDRVEMHLTAIRTAMEAVSGSA